MNGLELLVLGRILSWDDRQWNVALVAKDLGVDGAQVHRSIKTLCALDLIASKSRRMIYENIETVLCSALKYIYPPIFLNGDQGIPTMYSAWPLTEIINAKDVVVWKYQKEGEGVKGDRCLAPFHKRVPELCMYDRNLYAFCSLVDAIRAGRPREVEEGKGLLIKMFIKK